MNIDLFKGHWHIVIGRVKQAYGQLSHDELIKTSGDIQEEWGRIRRSVGEMRQKARRDLEELAKTV